VQRLTFDSYLYKRVVPMNPWQQIKLTVLTLASVLRGQALAPTSYRPVASVVRSEAEVALLQSQSSHKSVNPQAAAGSQSAAGNAPDPGTSTTANDNQRKPVTV
jgi:geranylgeranyl reductase